MENSMELNARTKEELFRRLLRRPGVTLVFGEPDTGKTTLIRELASRLARDAATAVIDCDIGQSSVGPPACLGACMVKGDLRSSNRAEALYFIGSFSPTGYFLPMLTGLSRLINWTKERNSTHVFVDTTGFVSGGAAFELKYHKVEIIQPGHLILLERDKELRPLAEIICNREQVEIHRFKPSRAASQIGMDERREYRENSVARYLGKAGLLSLPLSRKMLISPFSWRETQESEGLRNRLVGLLDGHGDTLAMGVIQGADFNNRTLAIKAPLASIEPVRYLRLGELYRSFGLVT